MALDLSFAYIYMGLMKTALPPCLRRASRFDKHMKLQDITKEVELTKLAALEVGKRQQYQSGTPNGWNIIMNG
jgi:hypothetical protein